MRNEELASLIEREISQSIGHGGAGGVSGSASSDLATERAMELDYYNGKPFGNEREGESQVVSTDVFDAVESMLPHLLKTFTASDDAVMFEPEGQEDEQGAKQRTDLCNYVFYKQNNGFLIMYEWFKDALLQKNGVVKYWWDTKTETCEETYEGLTEGEYLMLMKDDEGIEVLEHTQYDDQSAIEQRDAAIAKMQQAAQQNPQAAAMLQQVMSQPVPQMHDIKYRQTKETSKVCIKAIPPEEFGVSAKHTCISIQDAPFVYHRCKMTISDLRQMGCPDDVLESAGSDDGIDNGPEVVARNRFIDESGTTEQSAVLKEASKELWVVDCFYRIDFDGDGIDELRHIIKVGSQVWVNEESQHINFAAITPIIMPHRFIGKSIAEIVMDFQFINSTLLRQMFNNLYLTNNPQKVVLGTMGGQVMADLDRLMQSRVGGIQVEYTPNAIRNMEVPFVAGQSFPMLEYMEGKKEQRTGNTRYNQGTDADSLNKTARGIQLIQGAAQQKIDLVARIFAETGVKDLFRGIAYFLSKYSTKPMAIRLRNQWVDIDPRQWKTQFDMTVNVGLGTGNRDVQIAQLMKMNELQLELMKTGRGYMVTDQNVYTLVNKLSENLGFKHPDMFITNPSQVQKPPPQPPPEIIKMQTDAQIDAAKIKSNEQIKAMENQTLKEIEAAKAQMQVAIAQLNAQTSKELEQMRIQAQASIELYRGNNSADGEKKDIEVRKLGIGYEEQLLQLKKQLDAMAEQNRQQLTAQSDENQVKAADGIGQIVSQSIGTVAQQLSGVAQILQNTQIMLAKQLDVQTKTLEAFERPKNIRIGDIKKDASGNVIGVDNMTTTLQ